jgi:hypothetical protein
MASPKAVDRADRSCRLIPPYYLPCSAWHGKAVTSAHHEDVGLSPDGHASAPPSGAAASSQPAGASVHAFFSGLRCSSRPAQRSFKPMAKVPRHHHHCLVSLPSLLYGNRVHAYDASQCPYSPTALASHVSVSGNLVRYAWPRPPR